MFDDCDPKQLEELIPLRRIDRDVPEFRRAGRDGNPVSYSTWMRAALERRPGKKRLRSVRVASVLCTSRRWLLEFIDPLSGTAPSSPTQIETERRAARRTASVMRELEQAGI